MPGAPTAAKPRKTTGETVFDLRMMPFGIGFTPRTPMPLVTPVSVLQT